MIRHRNALPSDADASTQALSYKSYFLKLRIIFLRVLDEFRIQNRIEFVYK